MKTFLKISMAIWSLLLAIFIILIVIASNDKSDPVGWGAFGMAILALWTLIPSLCVILIIALLSLLFRNLPNKKREEEVEWRNVVESTENKTREEIVAKWQRKKEQ